MAHRGGNIQVKVRLLHNLEGKISSSDCGVGHMEKVFWIDALQIFTINSSVC